MCKRSSLCVKKVNDERPARCDPSCDRTDLLLSNPRVPQHAHALTDHRDCELVVFLEELLDLRQGGIVRELKAVPERPLCLAILGLGRCDGLRESEERQSQVDETVLVIF